VSRRSGDGVTEPDGDRGDVDGAAVDVVAFVEAGCDCAVAAQLVDGSFDDVPQAVGVDVVGDGPAAGAAASFAVAGLVSRFRDDGLDAASAQVRADAAAGVGLVGQDAAGARAGAPRAAAGDP